MSGGVDRDPRTEDPASEPEELSAAELARRRAELMRARNKALSPPAPLLFAGFGTVILTIILTAIYVVWFKDPDPYAGMSYVRTEQFYLVPTDELYLDVRLAPENKSVGILKGRVGRFLQSMIVGLDRQHVVAGLTDVPPLYEITHWNEQHITLKDLATGEMVALESYGTLNLKGLMELLRLADGVDSGRDPAEVAAEIGAEGPPLEWLPPPED